MAKRKQSTLSNEINQQIRKSLSADQLKQHEQLNADFIRKLQLLLQRCKNQMIMQESSMLTKMKLAQLDEEILSADVAKAFISQIVQGKFERDIFKELTMLTQWYQESLMEIKGQKAETRVLLVDKHGTIEINRFEHSSENQFSFSDLFSVSKVADSKGGGLKAKYKNSYKRLENQRKKGYSVTRIRQSEYTNLENTYFEALRRAKLMKQSFNVSGSKTTFQLGTGALIPVNTAKGIKYYNLSSLGDLNETYLRLQSEKTLLQSNNIEEQLIQLLEGTKAVNNTSALLVGDFSIGSVQVSAKSAGASAFGISQIIDYIYNLRALVESDTTRTQIYDDLSSFKYRQEQENGESQNNIEIPKEIVEQYVKELFEWT